MAASTAARPGFSSVKRKTAAGRVDSRTSCGRCGVKACRLAQTGRSSSKRSVHEGNVPRKVVPRTGLHADVLVAVAGPSQDDGVGALAGGDEERVERAPQTAYRAHPVVVGAQLPEAAVGLEAEPARADAAEREAAGHPAVDVRTRLVVEAGDASHRGSRAYHTAVCCEKTSGARRCGEGPGAGRRLAAGSRHPDARSDHLAAAS